MDARRDYLMKGLKKRCKRKQRGNKNNKDKGKRQDKMHAKTKFNSAKNMKKSKTNSFDEPSASGSNDKGKNYIEDLHGSIPKGQDFNSFTKLYDFHNDNHKNYVSSISKKREKPLESVLNDQETVNKDDDSLDLDHACADMLQNNIEQIKTELNTSKEKSHNSGKSHCIKPQRVTFGNKFKRNRKKCLKKKESEDYIENEAIPSTSGFKENRLSKAGTSDISEEETEDVVLYKNKNAESKHKSRRQQLQIDDVEDRKNGESKYKSRRKQPEINESDGSVEETRGAESKYKSRRKQPENNESDVSVEEDNRNVAVESKHKSRRKQAEINELDGSVEETRGAESKYKSRRKQAELNVGVEEDNRNAESKHKSRRKQPDIDELDICAEVDDRYAESKYKSRRKQSENNDSDVGVEEDNRNAESKHKPRRKQPEINETGDSAEEDSRNVESKHKSRRKQAELDVSVEEDNRNAESKHKSRRKQTEINELGEEESINAESKSKSRRKQPEINESEEDSTNAESKHKSRRKQLEINESDVNVEDGKNAESKHKSRRKQPVIDELDICAEVNDKYGESKYKSRRKQSENNESDVSVEEDSTNAESKHKSRRKQPEIDKSDMNVEDNKNTESKYKSQKKLPEIDESVISIEDNKPRQKENNYYDFVDKKKIDKYNHKQRPKINSESTRFWRESRRKRSRSSSLGESNHRLSSPSSSTKFDYPKKAGDAKKLERDYKNFDSKFSLDCKEILAAKKKKRKPKSASELRCTCEEILRHRRKRERSRNSECERLLKKQRKKKSSPKLSPSSKKLLKPHKKKTTSSECEKLLKKQESSCSQSSSSSRKLSDTHKKKKHRSPEREKLLKADRKKKSLTICTCKIPKSGRTSFPRRKRRKSYHAPVLEDCGKELKKLNRALSNKIQQKESQLLGSCKKGKRKKKVKSKPEELQVPNCRCASSDLKDRYTKMIEDYHRLKRQYEALKCTNALIEKKLRCFMKKSGCKCTR